MSRFAILALAFVTIACVGKALAQEGAASDGDLKRSSAILADMATRPFIEAHPDLRFRNLGMQAYYEGRKREAFHDFQLAARYVDKTSQALVALMYWNGDGVAQDRVNGYAWMELAASRGYFELQRQSDFYAAQLSETERAQAHALRQKLEADFGDEVGARRLTLELGSIRSQITGSHLGWVGNGVAIYADDASRAASGENVARLLGRGGGSSVDLSEIGDSARMDTAHYLRVKDLQWQVQMLKGHVEVGELQPVRKPSDGPHPAS